MFIRNFGQFWRYDEVNWFPGKGSRDFRLLGHRGTNIPKVRLADFRYQEGIYILYGNHGPYYTGLTTKQGLGERLKDHSREAEKGWWDRFSWFGFQQVLLGKDEDGICKLKELPGFGFGEPRKVIRDVEALLIRAMGLTNIAQTKFQKAEEWYQVKDSEVDRYLEKVT